MIQCLKKEHKKVIVGMYLKYFFTEVQLSECQCLSSTTEDKSLLMSMPSSPIGCVRKCELMVICIQIFPDWNPIATSLCTTAVQLYCGSQAEA